MWTDRYHDAGFQQMKIYSSVKLEELKVVADEAHRLGMTVTGHVPEGLNAYQAIEAGQDQINHIHYIADIMKAPLPENASRFDRDKARRDHRSRIAGGQEGARVSERPPHRGRSDSGAFGILYRDHRQAARQLRARRQQGRSRTRRATYRRGSADRRSEIGEKVFEKELAIVGALHRAGIPVVAGTDQTVPGYSLHREIELYVQAGFTPMEAIQAATIVPARVMGLDKESGTVEKASAAT